MKVTLIQPDIHWENAAANLRMYGRMLANAPSLGRLVLLPEMFNTGFGMNAPAIAESMDGPSVGWMRQMAKKYDAAIAGSLVVEQSGKYWNRLVWVQPSGQLFTYDKRHLFRMSKENEVYVAGVEPLVVELDGWRFCLQICYDLRFPVWSRNRFGKAGEAAYDCLVYLANWPQPRSLAWQRLLPARAVENLSYVLGVNRVGKDGNGIKYEGCSMAVDFLGGVMWQNIGETAVATVELDKNKLANYRQIFPAWMDADDFEIKL